MESDVLTVSFCEGVSDVGLVAVLKACGSIERLDVQGCKRITEQVGCYVPEVAPPSLSWLDLSWVNSVSPQVVAKVLTEHANASLEVVDYYGDTYDRHTVPREGDKSEMHKAISDAMDTGWGFG